MLSQIVQTATEVSWPEAIQNVALALAGAVGTVALFWFLSKIL